MKYNRLFVYRIISGLLWSLIAHCHGRLALMSYENIKYNGDALIGYFTVAILIILALSFGVLGLFMIFNMLDKFSGLARVIAYIHGFTFFYFLLNIFVSGRFRAMDSSSVHLFFVVMINLVGVMSALICLSNFVKDYNNGKGKTEFWFAPGFCFIFSLVLEYGVKMVFGDINVYKVVDNNEALLLLGALFGGFYAMVFFMTCITIFCMENPSVLRYSGYCLSEHYQIDEDSYRQVSEIINSEDFKD